MQANRRIMRRRLQHEPLEDRRMLAVVTWDGGGDDRSWTDPANWDNDVLPTSADDVVIETPMSIPSVTIESVTLDLRSIQSTRGVALRNAELTLTAGDSRFDQLFLSESTFSQTAGDVQFEDLRLNDGSTSTLAVGESRFANLRVDEVSTLTLTADIARFGILRLEDGSALALTAGDVQFESLYSSESSLTLTAGELRVEELGAGESTLTLTAGDMRFDSLVAYHSTRVLTAGNSQFRNLNLTGSTLTLAAGNSTIEGEWWLRNASVLAIEGEATSFTSFTSPTESSWSDDESIIGVDVGATATFLGHKMIYDVEVNGATADFPAAQNLCGLDVREHGVVTAPLVGGVGCDGGLIADSGGVIHLGRSVEETSASKVFVGEDSTVITQQLRSASFAGSGMVVGDIRIWSPWGPRTSFTISPELKPLKVLGSTTIGGSLSIFLAEGVFPVIGSTIPIVSSTTIHGEFESVRAASGVIFELLQSLDSINLRVIPDRSPRVASVDISDANEALEYIDVVFDQDICSRSSCEPAIRLRSSDTSVGIVDVVNTSANSIRIWPRISGAGEYELTISGVENWNRTGLDSDGDGVPGEPIEDDFLTTFVISDDTAPQVKSVQVGSISQGPITDFFVTFTELIDSSSFDSTDLVIRDEDGQVVDVGFRIEPHAYVRFSNQQQVDRSGVDDSYRVFLQGQLPPGAMTLEIGPFIENVSGLLLNQDGDEIFGEDADRFQTELSRPLPLPLGSLTEHGALVEVFVSPLRFREITPSFLDRLTPDIAGIVETIDFAKADGFPFFSADSDPLSTFLGPAFQVDEEHALASANSFRLRSSFYLEIREELDLNPATPEIDIRLGFLRDDGFWLSVGGQFIDRAGDSFHFSEWHSLSFSTAGVYPVDLLFYANEGGGSGLQVSWHTAIDGETVIPPNEIYLDTSRILAGDVNGNGRVDSTDLGLLLNNFGDQSSDLGWVNGDLNGDDVVDAVDLGEVLNNFGVSSRMLALLSGEEDDE